MDIFTTTDIEDIFPKISINTFDNFIRAQVMKKQRYISPYKFAYEHNITVNESVKFFMYFTGDDNLFEPIYYFECSRPSCYDSRIYLDINDLDRFICDECGKKYKFETIQRYIKVLFKLSDSLDLPKESKKITKKDPNSTYEALKELPPHLKLESPSHSASQQSFTSEGDELNPEEGVDLQLVMELNTKNDGTSISPAVERFKEAFMSLEEK